MKGSFAKWTISFIVILLVIPCFISLWNHKGEPVPQEPTDPKGPRVKVIDPRGKVLGMGLEEYVKGVVYAEMPLGFSVQALAAQAVASRTYAYKRLSEDPTRPLSSDPASHQGWKAWKMRLPIISGLIERRLNKAMAMTTGEIMTYDGKPIDAVYHSTSGPRTEDSGEVWGKGFPYLQSVDCPYCSDSPKLKQRFVLSYKELREALGFVGDSRGRVSVVIKSRTDTGRVKEVACNGIVMKGTGLRGKLGLPSATFTVVSDGSGVTFDTVGYGHGVGMCQYGAQGMAEKGSGYHDILRHYYRGIGFSKVG